MEYNLLSSLRKYRPRENHDPLENFITEAFAWLLKNNKDFSSYFLDKIFAQLPAFNGSELGQDLDCLWDTQVNFGGVFPDMVAKLSNEAILVFEHKVWATLHPSQLDNYKQFSYENYSSFHLILITANESQHLQDPDLSLCWRDVYAWIEEWIQSETSKSNFIFLDFLNLLKEEGLGPVAPISHAGILSYYSARGFRDQVIDLIQQAEKRDWSHIHPQISVYGFRKPNGKVFYDGNGRVALLMFDDGCPSLTTGFILDWEHYHTQPLLGAKSPDFSIMLRLTDKNPDKYFNLKIYQDFVGKLESRIKSLGDGWVFYHHLDDEQISQKHKGFPIHIRKPMLGLLRGTENSEDQVNRFMQANETILKEILACQEFWDMRQAFVEEASQGE